MLMFVEAGSCRWRNRLSLCNRINESEDCCPFHTSVAPYWLREMCSLSLWCSTLVIVADQRRLVVTSSQMKLQHQVVLLTFDLQNSDCRRSCWWCCRRDRSGSAAGRFSVCSEHHLRAVIYTSCGREALPAEHQSRTGSLWFSAAFSSVTAILQIRPLCGWNQTLMMMVVLTAAALLEPPLQLGLMLGPPADVTVTAAGCCRQEVGLYFPFSPELVSPH